MKETFVHLVLGTVECNIYRNNHITKDVRPLNCSVMAYVALERESLKTPAIG